MEEVKSKEQLRIEQIEYMLHNLRHVIEANTHPTKNKDLIINREILEQELSNLNKEIN